MAAVMGEVAWGEMNEDLGLFTCGNCVSVARAILASSSGDLLRASQYKGMWSCIPLLGGLAQPDSMVDGVR